MKNKKRIIIGIVLLLSFSLSIGNNHTGTNHKGTTEATCNECFMEKFAEAVEKMKKVCKKNPNNPMCKRLHSTNALNANIDVNSVIKIANHLKEEEPVKNLSEKITKKLKNNPDLIKRCFVDGDKKSCAQFRKNLKLATFKCGGFRCIRGNGRIMCEAAAYCSAAECLECQKTIIKNEY